MDKKRNERRYLIVNTMIYDGTKTDPFCGSILIEDEEIIEVKKHPKKGMEPPECFDGKVIDGAGLATMPGFIDIHTHSDISIFAAPDASAKVFQGVTTDVIGNCSIGPAPSSSHLKDWSWRKNEENWLKRAGIDPSVLSWEKWSDFARTLKDHKKGINIAGLVPHGPVRAKVMGFSKEKATAADLKEMKDHIKDGMEAGAFGFSSGLTYTPSKYSTIQELVEISKEVAKFDGYYASHIRSERDELIEAIEEAILIGIKASVPIQISHFKVMGRSNWGLIERGIELINQHLDSVDITCDVYPYIFSSTFPQSLKTLTENGDNFLQKKEGVYWEDIIIIDHPNKEYIGKNLKEVAKEENIGCQQWLKNNWDEEEIGVKIESISITDLEKAIKFPKSMIGSDSYGMNASEVFTSSWVNPRNFGAFPKVFKDFVREGILSWSEAVNKMTLMPATKLGLKDRGMITAGMKADLTIVSKDDFEDQATLANPFRYSKGIEFVFINGKPVIKNGKLTGSKPGAFLEKSR